MPRPETETPVRERILIEARAIIEARGVEQLSLRDVARRIGVSHQAPYKHFASRDHIIAELVARAYSDFSGRLDAAASHGSPHARLAAMAAAYLRYAAEFPLNYRLMFETPLPPVEDHPDMMAKARAAFGMLTRAIAALPERQGVTRDQIEREALLKWTVLHGAASLSHSPAIETLTLSDGLKEDHARLVLDHLEQSLAAQG